MGVDRYAKPTLQPGSGTPFKEVLHDVQVNVHETPHEKVTEYARVSSPRPGVAPYAATSTQIAGFDSLSVLPPDWLAYYLSGMVIDTTRVLDLRAEGPLPDSDPLSRGGDITCPVLLIAGEHDFMAPPALVSQLATRIHAVEVLEVAGVGHGVHEERPEWLVQTIRDWLGKQ